MAKTLAQIREQIASLQEKEKVLLSREVSNVVDRIREAIAYYSLTPAQLFQEKSSSQRARRAAATRSTRSANRRGVAARQANTSMSAPSPFKGKKIAVKYRDQDGNTWTGRGSQPRWLRAALTTGKKVEDFLIRPR